MSQRLNYPELAPEAVAAMRSVEHALNTTSNLDPTLLELVRLRCSLLNGCEYCIGLHTHLLQKHNETTARIACVREWRDFDGYTQRERAALAWSEIITNIQQGHAADADYETARKHFDDTELVNLTFAIASINAFNRLAIAFRAEHRSKTEGQTPQTQPDAGDGIADDGGKVATDE